MIPAGVPIQHPTDARLLVVHADGAVSHRARAEFPELVRGGDIVVANDAATLPASLSGVHVPTGADVEVRLAGRDSLSSERVERFLAIAFGGGDFHMPTEHRPPPPAFRPGDTLRLGPLRASVVRVLAHPRLIELRFQNSVPEIWEGLARHGRPIQYAYISEPLHMWDTWTRIAGQPVAFEPPSAGFLLDWTMIQSFRSRGAQFATLTHAAGISSTGDAALDALLPFDEPYYIPSSTAMLIRRAKRHGGRVIAVGTTVVRALEHAARPHGTVRSGEGMATGRIGALTRRHIVDALVTGIHEPGTSHFELLRSFQGDRALCHMVTEAEAHGYNAHEFGDSALLIAGHAVPDLRLRTSGCARC
jgi:S-adenosylmethionine:tRNA ribosyltransferase-isomerase